MDGPETFCRQFCRTGKLARPRFGSFRLGTWEKLPTGTPKWGVKRVATRSRSTRPSSPPFREEWVIRVN
jgi:hypothetical protein